MTTRERNELEKEILDTLFKDARGKLPIAPRFGKSKLIINYIKKHKYNKILWVTPFTQLAEVDIPNEFVKWRAKKYLKELKTVTWSSLNKITGHFDIIILDESQYITENNSVTLISNKLSSDSLLAMSGTESESFDKIDLYKKLKLETLYDINIRDAVNLNILSNYKINVVYQNYDRKNWLINKLEMELKPIGKYTIVDDTLIVQGPIGKKYTLTEHVSQKGVSMHKIYFNSFIRKGYYMKDVNYGKLEDKGETWILKDGNIHKEGNHLTLFNQIKKYPQKEVIAKHLLKMLGDNRKLIYCSSIDQSNRLCKHTYNSKTKDTDLKLFLKNEVDTLGLVNTGSVGFTFENLNHIILLQADSDKNGRTTQRICRALLNDTKQDATIWIVCLKNTHDENLVRNSLKKFHAEKVNYVEFKTLQNTVYQSS